MAEIKEEEKLKLKKLIRELEKIKGRHTELVSVYVPAGYNLAEAANQLFQEKGTASNIKSKTTRKNVLTALEKILQHLKLFRKTPDNGLVIFCGNVSEVEGREDIRLWSYEPPVPISQKIYWCDQTFVLDPLRDLISEKEVYGLIVLDAKEATIGLLKGKRIEKLKSLESTVPSKTVKGGMSQKRYDRLRDDALNEFLVKVGEEASNLLLKQENLKGVLIGGPGPVKETFYDKNYLHYQIQKKVLGVKDIGSTDEYGLEELVFKAQDLLKEAMISKEREIMQKFFAELKNNGNVVYGFEETKKALEAGAVDVLLISEEFNWLHAKFKCVCGYVEEKDLPRFLIEKQKCQNCGQKLIEEESYELLDQLVEKASSLGTKVEYISTETSEGIQFKELGGIGAFLRYKIQ
ncbi:MAG: peptide chain release factor aRF-1 [Candidatus Aenigmatarchaeota archaeon]